MNSPSQPSKQYPDSTGTRLQARYFCTYLDSNYLTRGLALYQSLLRYSNTPVRLWVLCFDGHTFNTLRQLALPGIEPIALADFERDDHRLARAKSNRSTYEYYLTCTPSLPLYILHHYPEVDLISYVDADILFFSDPKPIYDELGEHSILIIPHRFSPPISDRERYGIYNVQFVSFRRDVHGLACLNWWRKRCLEWCYDRLEDDRFADQKYLDEWPQRFQNLVVLQHRGAGVAPWNIGSYSIDLKNGVTMIDSQPLIFFHFHGFRIVNRWLVKLGLMDYEVRISNTIVRRIYQPYIDELRRVAAPLIYHKETHETIRPRDQQAYRFRNTVEMVWRRELWFVLT